MEEQDPNRADQERRFGKDDPKPGEPKRAHRDYVSGGKNLNKDSREELKKKH
ncbi:MAG TPA: hypothetical protein VEA80_06035 [Vitreimonas sp.]|uniref:hypothetical protein n=1 Tax=Vitreimonas sp. TaxID=3069702 RepID=UPI002D5770CA|nr:hypothetical protein [Vitreimonas sp.]HYD87012.1 hypothetical protein [Vitreimonas sp.]